MADPLSVLGAAIGITSLLLQVVDECVKGYHFYCTVASVPKEHQYLIVRLQMEQRRFLAFSEETGLLGGEQDICDALRVKLSLLLTVLSEIKYLFDQTTQKLKKYPEQLPQASQEKVDLSSILQVPDLPLGPEHAVQPAPHSQGWKRNVSRTAKNFRDIARDPRRLVWASVDKEAIERMLAKLSELNSFLFVLLDGSQKQRLQAVVDSSYLEIVQVREGVQNLQLLFAALKPSHMTKTSKIASIVGPAASNSVFHELVEHEVELEIKRRTYLLNLTEIKIQYNKALKESMDSAHVGPNTKLLATDSLRLLKRNGAKHSLAQFNEDSVWIEWMRPAKSENARSTAIAEHHSKLLTDLICDQTFPGFCLPLCLGYIKREHKRYEPEIGLVFRHPSQDSSEKPNTLRQLLVAGGVVPSLSKRIGLCAILAKCIYSYHSVGWLHKGIRSDSIVFFGGSSKDDEMDLESAYLVGLQLSRPDVLDEMTFKPSYEPLEDIYRHPSAQSGGDGSRYRKSYDLYSLGIVMMELVLWKPIEVLVGLTGSDSISASDVVRVKSLVDKESQLQKIAAAAGDTVQKAIASCLRADLLEQPIEQDENTMSAEIRLQRMLHQDVVEKLEQVAHVLKT